MTQKLSRRAVLKAALRVTTISTAAGAGVTLYSTQVEPQWHTVEQVHIPITNLPEPFIGYRIIHLSDIHIMDEQSISIAKQAIQAVQGTHADAIVITGDYVTHSVDGDDLINVLTPLQAPDGIWTVMGNHDHWTDVHALRAVLGNLGIRELRNANTPIEREGARLWLAGVDDIWEQQHDLDRALAGIPQGEATVLLAHEPDFADAVYPTGRVHLQLSGHSHGGQVRLPFVGAPVLPYLGEKYPIGRRKLGPMWLYTNRGLGSIPPVVRLNCRPEVTVITLARG